MIWVSMVTFEMTVYNQGNVTATEVEVTNQFAEYLQFNEVNESRMDSNNRVQQLLLQ